MAQYIDKSALVAEIERIKKEECPNDTYEGRNKLFYFERFLSFLNTLEVKEVQEEPVSNDLEEAARKAGQEYFPDEYNIWARPNYEAKKAEYAFKAGANWQKEQMEKSRIEHCHSITEKQYNLETGFIDQYIDKHHCMPTFLSAIEYGMEKQKGQMIKKACEWLEEHLLDFWSQKITNTDYFIEEFKKAMKE